MSDALSGLGLGGATRVADLLAHKPARRPAVDADKDADGATKEAKAAQQRAQAVQVAKDFESVLLHRMLSEMRNSIPDSGLLQDGTGEQIESMFWMFLSRHVADNGGVGLWKEIYREAVEADASTQRTSTMEQLR